MQRNAPFGAAVLVFLFVSWLPNNIRAQVITAPQGSKIGTLTAQTYRPLRYQPVGTDFVIANGQEFFNRPLYGGHTAFRVDGGDKPEFVLYLPGRGGNLRFGLKTAQGQKWLHDAKHIITRYRPGSLLYEIRDPLLGPGVLHLTVLAMYEREGLLVRAEAQGTSAPLELLWAYGGVNGVRGRRDGDIGTENVPISQFFQFQPEFARDNKFSIGANNFTLASKAAQIVGVMPPDAKLVVADGAKWHSLTALVASADQASDAPIILGQKTLPPKQVAYFAWQRTASAQTPSPKLNETLQPVTNPAPVQTSVYRTEDLPRIFEEAEKYRQALVGQVMVETPDPFINAAVAALNVGADAVWDEPQGAFMHGAIAWRTKLLGWRGPYLGDALGWHDRMRKHLEYWATRQNTQPISRQPIKPDATVNFARNEPELHTNGDLSNSHYDMNLVYIDALFRHLLWTGDVEFAKKMFPVIQRHLAWEQRLFRREYGAEKLPLYEAYVAIWASDDLQYHGSGVTHSTAYNYYHNKMAARIAQLIGADPTPYERETALILSGMRQHLWLKQQGWFGEYKDLLGLQRVHESAAVWTFYHAVDSETTTPQEAWQMSRFIDTQIPHLPIHGVNVPPEDLQTISTTSWLPYTWSTNNVVMSEVMHTALAYWQTGRSAEAFKLYKAAILDSMFMGIAPGNVGSMTYLDAHRRESQRDFADPAGTKSRALIEGLFGLKPDVLAGELTLKPGFPTAWQHAQLKHPDINFSFRRNNLTDSYVIAPKFPRPLTLRLQVTARRDQIERVTVNGKPVAWKVDEHAIGQPLIEIAGAPSPRYEVEIVWRGPNLESVAAPSVVAAGAQFTVNFGHAKLREVADPQHALQNVVQKSNSFTAQTTANCGQRTVFVQLQQGAMTWQQPVMFAIRPAFEILPKENQEADGLRFTVRNNTPQPINNQLDILINGKPEKSNIKVAAWSASREIVLPSKALVTGSNSIKINFGPGLTAQGVVQNWKIKSAHLTKFEPVNLTPVFNDQVTNIFRREYLSPRSPYVSLAMPKQGIGSWAHFNETFEVDDTGLRRVADSSAGQLILPNGVPFQTIGAKSEKNIAFVSQWDNFPREISAPLSGKAAHVYLLMAGSTNQMQSRFANGEVIVTYTDNSSEKLTLENPTTWWPIDQDYMIDDYAFRRPEAIPPRVDLATGQVRILDLVDFKTKGRKVPGGAATVLDVPLDANKDLKALTVRALANEVVIGLMSATLARN